MKKMFCALALAGSVALGACSDDNGTGPDNNIEGTYTLTTIEGEDLPVTVFAFEGYTLEVLSGQVRLMDDNEFTASLTFRETTDGDPDTYTESDTGTWSRSGNTVTFTYSDPELEDDVATFSNGRLTLESEGITLVFEE